MLTLESSPTISGHTTEPSVLRAQKVPKGYTSAILTDWKGPGSEMSWFSSLPHVLQYRESSGLIPQVITRERARDMKGPGGGASSTSL